MYKVVNGSSLSYLASVISQHVSSRYLHSSDTNLFVVLITFQNLVIKDLVFVDFCFGVISSNVLKLCFNLKPY